MRKNLLATATLAILVASGSHSLLAAQKLFDPTRDPAADLAAAEIQAAQQNKNILLDIGGNWCGWCLLLERTIHDAPPLESALSSRFIVLHVNVSKENANKAFLAQYPPVNGYPFWFVLSPSGQLLASQGTDTFETDHKLADGYSKERLQTFFDRWAPSR